MTAFTEAQVEPWSVENVKAVVPAVMVEAEGAVQGAALIPSKQGWGQSEKWPQALQWQRFPTLNINLQESADAAKYTHFNNVWAHVHQMWLWDAASLSCRQWGILDSRVLQSQSCLWHIRDLVVSRACKCLLESCKMEPRLSGSQNSGVQEKRTCACILHVEVLVSPREVWKCWCVGECCGPHRSHASCCAHRSLHSKTAFPLSFMPARTLAWDSAFEEYIDHLVPTEREELSHRRVSLTPGKHCLLHTAPEERRISWIYV